MNPIRRQLFLFLGIWFALAGVAVAQLPSGWLDTDVGNVLAAGSATYSGGTFTVKAAGNIGSTADGMHFVYQPLTGDGWIIARVGSLQGGVTSPQAGVMIRESLGQSSTDTFVYFQGSYGYFQTRATTGASASVQWTSFSSAAYPYWVKLARSGNVFTGYVSKNAVDWTQIGTSATVTMASSVYIGLALSTGGSSTLETAAFDSVSVNSTAAPAPTITSISATTGSVGGQVTITGANFGDFQGTSSVLLNGTAMTINSWSSTSIVFTIPTEATSGPLLVSVAPTMNDSNSIYFTLTSQPLPSGWLDADVGSPTVIGSATYSGGSFTVMGGGTIGSTADSMHYVYQSLMGDGSITGRVVSQQGSSPQAVLMIRETLTANSKDAYIIYAPNTANFIYRATIGGSISSQSGGNLSGPAPYWLRLVRSGNTFTAYTSKNGFDWAAVGTSATVSMAQSVYIGMAVAGGSGSSGTGMFDNISISSTAAPAPVITGISATTASVGSQVTITGANFGNSQGASQLTLNGTAMTINSWSATSIVFTIPTAATSGPLLVSVAPSMNDSNSIYFTVTSQPLPSGWPDTDVGNPSAIGSATYSGGTFTVKASGNIGGTADGMHFVYQPLNGDGSIIARVSSLQGATYPQAGVMIRESLGQGSTFAFVYFLPNQAYLFSRTTTGGASNWQATSFNSSAYPYWVKLARSGNAFTAFISKNAIDWTQVGTSTTITMASSVYIGLALSSGGSGTLETANFDSVSVNSPTAPAPVITNVSGTSGSVGSQVTITGANFGTTPGSQVTVNGTAMTINSWNPTSIVFTIPTGATSGLLLVSVAPSMNDSNSIYFTVTSQPLPSGWFDADVGSPTVIGSATYSGGSFTATSGGGTIGSTADAMHYAYQSLVGDGSITGRVVSVQGSSPQIVLMIRETLTTSSKDAYITYAPNTANFIYRATTGGSTSSQSGYTLSGPAPYWLRLVRSGNTFNGYTSKNGFDWAVVGTGATVSMAQSVYIGMGVAGGSATFDNISISSTAVPAPVITGLSATTASVGSQVQITGNNFGSSPGNSLVTLNGTSVPINLWTNTSIVFTVPTGATSGFVVVSVAPSMNDSNPVYLAVTSQPLPTPWLDLDIGTISATGSATYSGGTFTVKGSGNIGGSTEGLHFVYQSLVGDGSIIARVASQQGSTYPQVGVMIRETLSPGSTYAFVYFLPNQGYLYTRSTTGGSSSSQATGFSSSAYPYWVRLIRTGSTFTSYVSTDGSAWTQVGSSTTITMASNVYIGLAVTAGSGTLETATFDNASVTVGTTPFVSSVAPLVGGVGTAVTITGSNFGATQGNSTVQFNGAVASSVSSWSSSQLVATVPSNVPAGTGPVTVTVNSIQSNGNVMFTAVNPVISNITPPGAAQGAKVVLNGTGFMLSGEATQVSFNGVSAQVLSYSNTSITVFVPPNATSGPVTVTVGSYTSTAVQFTVEPQPSISGISPTSGQVGSHVTITGAGFGASQSNSVVNFYLGLPAQIVSWSDTSIVASVPPGASTGAVSVQVATFTGQGPSFQITSVTQLTDSLGNQSSYTMAITGGHWLLESSQGTGCSSCSIRGNIQETTDANGNVLTHTDDLGHTSTYTYDSNDNLTSTSQQLDANTTVATSYTYNSFGEVLTMTDPLGNITTNAYDAKGNLTSVTTPAPDANTAASVTQFTYDAKGQLSTITDPLNHVTTLAYTATGLIQTITDAQNHVTSYAYDARGNRTSVIDPVNGSSHPTTFSYDSMNRLTGITYPDGTSVSFGYDSRGRRTSVTDQNNRTTTYAYDDADRLTSVTNAASNVTTYAYDTESNLTSITDANNHTTYFTYDANGRVTKTTFPSTLYETYGYDAVGNLTSKTDRKNQTIQYVYDALNRLQQKTYPDSTNVEYVYDLAGKIKQVTDPSGGYSFAYDNMGRLIGTTTQYSFLPGSPFTNAYTYDAGSNRKSLTAPDGSITTYGYDTLNRLNGMANSWAGSFGFSYDALSRRTQLTRPNGINTNYAYDSVSRLLSVLHQTGSTTLDGASYTYDSAGNRSSKTNYLNNVTEGYTYDLLYQLTQVTQGASTTESYTYDSVGNRLSSLTVPTYTYNSSNQLTSNSSGNFAYDANGNTLSDAQGRSFTWDFENRLTQAVNPGVGTTTFRYDPFGRRIQKSGFLGTTNYLYDGSNLLAEIDNSGNLLARYSQGSDEDEHLSQLRSSNTSYYDQDAVASVTSLSNPAGGLTNTYSYDSFGNLTGSTGSNVNPYRFTGREFDSESGIYYNRARYYDPMLGRFASEDPLRWFGNGVNFYSYVNSNPVNDRDPSGQKKFHGNWCGPDWTGGRTEQYDPAHDPLYKPPVDDLDRTCEHHDKCYYACRRDHPCDKEARAACMRQCDDVLTGEASSVVGNQNWGYGYMIWWGIEAHLKPDPGSNESCGCKKNSGNQ